MATFASVRHPFKSQSLLIPTHLTTDQINQMNAQIKINDMWKAANIPNYSTKIQKRNYDDNTATTRAVTRGTLVEDANFSNLSRMTFINDAKKAWNKVPNSIKNCSSQYTAKKLIKEFVKHLPI